jgi:hypothetical protein
MKHLILTISVCLLYIFATGQNINLPQNSIPNFEEYYNEEYKNSLWFLPHLTDNYSEFITFTEFTVWSQRKVALSLAISKDSTFIVTQTAFPLDTPNVYSTRQSINIKEFEQIIDSLIMFEVFTLKDEIEVADCVKYTEDTLNGQKIVGINSTKNISDGLQTLIVFYSKRKYRFTSYYELDTAKEYCPDLTDWIKAVLVRNLIKSLFEKYRREGKWRRHGMQW